MSNPYEKVKGGRLTFKGGSVAISSKGIDKKKKKHKNKIKKVADDETAAAAAAVEVDNSETGGGGDIYTIDAAKKLQYEQLFPVEAKKFCYEEKSKFNSVEDALDDRVKKKADRYCK